MKKNVWKKTGISIILILTLINILFLFTFFKGNTTDEEHKAAFSSSYNIYTVDIPDSISFAGEPVPIHYFDVKEALDREFLVNIYWQSQTLLFIKRANRYFPVIEKILKENGVPDDFKYIPVVESGFLHVVSPADAAGFWQFLEATAKENGLEVNSEVDERYHLEKATQAACQYFLSAKQLFGNWTLAAASYNVGKTELKKQIIKQQTNSYYDLRLNNETARYIYRILAVKIIMSNPQSYGFQIRKKDLYPIIPVKKIQVDTSISDLTEFAVKQGINFKMLRYFNPWLRSEKLTNHRRTIYTISIPLEGYREIK